MRDLIWKLYTQEDGVSEDVHNKLWELFSERYPVIFALVEATDGRFYISAGPK